MNPGTLKAVFAFEVITILIEIQTNKFNLFAAMTVLFFMVVTMLLVMVFVVVLMIFIFVLFPMTMGVRMGARWQAVVVLKGADREAKKALIPDERKSRSAAFRFTV